VSPSARVRVYAVRRMRIISENERKGRMDMKHDLPVCDGTWPSNPDEKEIRHPEQRAEKGVRG